MDLFTRAKAMFSSASDDEITRGIQTVKSKLPVGASDDEVLNTAQKAMEAGGGAPAAAAPAVKDINPPSMTDDFSPAAREKLVEEKAASSKGPSWLAGLAAFGAGIQGKDAGAAGQRILSLQEQNREQPLRDFDNSKQLLSKRLEELRIQKKQAEEDKAQSSLDDLSSEETLMAQSLASKMLPAKDFSKMTATQINKALPNLSKIYDMEQRKLAAQEQASINAETRQINRELKEDDRENKRSEQRMAKNVRALEAYNKDPNTRKLIERQNTASNAEALLEMENPIADSAVGTQLARMAGEVGNLTENDIARFNGSPDLVSRAKKFASKNVSGLITESDRQLLKEMVVVFKQKNNQSELRQAKNFAAQYGRAYDLPESELIQILAPGAREPEPAGNKKVRLSNGSEIVDVDPEDVAEALKEGFKPIMEKAPEPSFRPRTGRGA